MSLPLLIPWNVVGTILQIFGRVDIRLLGYRLTTHEYETKVLADAFTKITHDLIGEGDVV